MLNHEGHIFALGLDPSSKVLLLSVLLQHRDKKYSYGLSTTELERKLWLE